MTNQQKIDGIQVLRGICVILTICAHLPLTTEPFSKLGFHAPYIIGVSIFYGISGWIIAHVTNQLTIRSITSFYIKRLCRILPILYCSLAFSLIVAFILPHKDFINQFYPDIESTLHVVVQNIIFMVDAAPYMGLNVPLSLAGLWSISVEVKFYLIYGLILIFSNRLRIYPLLFLLILTFVLRWWLLDSAIVYSHAFYIELFMLGAISYRLRQAFYRNSIINYGAWACIFLFPMFELKNQNFFLGYLVFCASVIYVINYFATSALKIKWLTWTGERSYILYVFHFQFLAIAGLLGQYLQINSSHPLIYSLLLVMGVIAGLPVVEFLHHVVEKKGIQLGHKLSNKTIGITKISHTEHGEANTSALSVN